MESLLPDFWNVPYIQKPPTDHGGRIQPFSLPDEEEGDTWPKFLGADDWVGLLDPLDPTLRTVLLRYGKFAQGIYDAFDFDPFSKYCGSSRYDAGRLLDMVGLGASGYVVTKYLYATMSELPMPLLLQPLLRHWLPKSLRIDSWSEDSNWMGFVAVSDDDKSRRLGRRDILVAWRGTMEPSEWYKNAQFVLAPLGTGGAMVEHGFHSIYVSRSSSSKYTNLSASEQVMAEIRRLVDEYHTKRKEVVSLTITGHSLGGALALLNAHEAPAASTNGLSHVSVVSFAAPRVGNAAFGEELAKAGVKVLRVVIQQDVVTKIPGLVLIPGYAHAGVEKNLDMRDARDLNYSWLDFPLFHSLKTYLRLVELQRSSRRRPAALSSAPEGLSLVDMPSEMLEDVLRARACWYRMVDMGLVQGPPGWGWPEREAEDVPTPGRGDGDVAEGAPPHPS